MPATQQPLIATRQELDHAVKVRGHGQARSIILTSACHETAAMTVSYGDGVMTAACGVCGTPVVSVSVQARLDS